MFDITSEHLLSFGHFVIQLHITSVSLATVQYMLLGYMCVTVITKQFCIFV